jgi:hypothetical protein
MNFSAVKQFFQPVSGAQLDQLVRRHAGTQARGEPVLLEEVGLERAAREATEAALPAEQADGRRRTA